MAGLREMTAAARIAVVVNDLLRRRLSLGLVWLATRLLRCHPISRHDGPLSVRRRSYSRDELRRSPRGRRAHRLTVREYPVLGRMLAVLFVTTDVIVVGAGPARSGHGHLPRRARSRGPARRIARDFRARSSAAST